MCNVLGSAGTLFSLYEKGVILLNQMQVWKKDFSNKHHCRGSLVVEAAFVFPIFFFFIAIFLYIFQFIYVQQTIQGALYQTAGYYAKQGYLYDRVYDTYAIEPSDEIAKITEALGVKEILTSKVYEAKFIEYLGGKTQKFAIIQGGIDGISIQPQCDYYEGGMVDVCAYYVCRIPVLFFQTDSFPCIQRAIAVNWSGKTAVSRYVQVEKTEEAPKEDVVYITKTGTVYHTHQDCTHLKLSIRQTTFGLVGNQRNQQNQKYRECDKCARNVSLSATSILYITDEGVCYHTSSTCSGIKRNIDQVSVLEIPSGMRCCRRCQKRDQSETKETSQDGS